MKKDGITEYKMSKPVEIEIKLFGVFKKFSDGGALSLTIDDDSTVGEIKVALAKRLGSKELFTQGSQITPPSLQVSGLVERSVLADEKRILKETDTLGERRSLAILPPVCGG